MYLIIGLGNPEEEYSNTRHNMGFDTINKIAEKHKINVSKNKFQGLYGTGTINGEKVVLLKPQTYMNLSGISAAQFVNFYKLSPKEVIVIYDDLDIEKGTIKVRKQGGPGTHNGMKSIVSELGNTEFYRIRVGIGSPDIKGDLANYVLQRIPTGEKEILEKATENAANAVQTIITEGIDKAMNLYN